MAIFETVTHLRCSAVPKASLHMAAMHMKELHVLSLGISGQVACSLPHHLISYIQHTVSVHTTSELARGPDEAEISK